MAPLRAPAQAALSTVCRPPGRRGRARAGTGVPEWDASDGRRAAEREGRLGARAARHHCHRQPRRGHWRIPLGCSQGAWARGRVQGGRGRRRAPAPARARGCDCGCGCHCGRGDPLAWLQRAGPQPGRARVSPLAWLQRDGSQPGRARVPPLAWLLQRAGARRRPREKDQQPPSWIDRAHQQQICRRDRAHQQPPCRRPH